jgi:hypothetical protein
MGRVRMPSEDCLSPPEKARNLICARMCARAPLKRLRQRSQSCRPTRSPGRPPRSGKPRSRACLCPDQRRHRCDGPAGLKTVIHRDDCPGEAVVLPVPDCPSRGAGELTKGPAGLSSRRRCDLPPFHALAARRTLAGCTRHKAAVRSSTTSRAKGIARHTPKMTSSHAGHGRGQAPHDLTGNDHKVVPADTVSDGESSLAASARGAPFLAPRGPGPSGLSSSGREDSLRCSSYAATAAASTYDPRSR